MDASDSHGGQVAAVGPGLPGPAAGRPDAIKAIPIRRWGRWVSAAIIVYLFAAVLYSFITNANVDWPTVWEDRKSVV